VRQKAGPLLDKLIQSNNLRFRYIISKPRIIIFVVAWLPVFFYMPRLLIYNTEAAENGSSTKGHWREQFSIMIRRLLVCHRLAGSHSHPGTGVTEWTLMGSLPTGC